MRHAWPCALALVLLAPAAAGADAEGDLRAEWRGAWVLTRTTVFSECTDHFTDNEVSGARVTGGPLRFGAGEVAQVTGLDWTITGLKVRVELAEPYRVEWEDGPFTLYEQRRCRVELKYPRSARPSAAAASSAIAAILQPVESQAAAQASEAWNRRRVEAYPEDWARTRAEHAAWKAQQVNADVARKLDEVLEQADRVVGSYEEDPEYAAAFVKGMRARRNESFSSCASALTATFYVTGGDGGHARGWADGQRLAWCVRLAAELR